MKKLLVCLFIAAFGMSAFGQKYYTKDGEIKFDSNASMEKIEAVNKRVTAVLDTETGAVEFALLVKAFQFEKALMQEHFNENYMESDKYPKAMFKGQIADMKAVNFNEDGEYAAVVEGMLTIHGESNKMQTDVVFVVKEGAIKSDAKFNVSCADYKIKIPKVVVDNIAKELEISVSTNLVPLIR